MDHTLGMHWGTSERHVLVGWSSSPHPNSQRRLHIFHGSMPFAVYGMNVPYSRPWEPVEPLEKTMESLMEQEYVLHSWERSAGVHRRHVGHWCYWCPTSVKGEEDGHTASSRPRRFSLSRISKSYWMERMEKLYWWNESVVSRHWHVEKVDIYAVKLHFDQRNVPRTWTAFLTHLRILDG